MPDYGGLAPHHKDLAQRIVGYRENQLARLVREYNETSDEACQIAIRQMLTQLGEEHRLQFCTQVEGS
jgi:hypothetical protein